MELAYNGILLTMLAGSVYTDLRWRLIKNIIVFPAIILGLLLRYFDAGLAGFGVGFHGMLFGLLMLLIPYLLIGGIGEGDVKLMAAIGVLTGPQFVIWAALAAAIYGALISLAVLAKERKVKDALAFTVCETCRLARFDFKKTGVEQTGPTIAYAVPIAMGVMTIFLWGGVV